MLFFIKYLLPIFFKVLSVFILGIGIYFGIIFEVKIGILGENPLLFKDAFPKLRLSPTWMALASSAYLISFCEPVFPLSQWCPNAVSPKRSSSRTLILRCQSSWHQFTVLGMLGWPWGSRFRAQEGGNQNSKFRCQAGAVDQDSVTVARLLVAAVQRVAVPLGRIY